MSTWEKYIAQQEDTFEEMCIGTAIEEGHTPTEAYDCDNGSVGCNGCPFKKENINE